MQYKRADPFNYKLRSMAEVKEQIKFFPPDFMMFATYKRYAAGDMRIDDPANMDDRERVSKIEFDLRDMKLSYR